MVEARGSSDNRGAFTLIELVVVCTVLGVLLIVSLLALGAVRKSTRRADTLATFHAIKVGLEAYRLDSAEGYPPSSSGLRGPEFAYAPLVKPLPIIQHLQNLGLSSPSIAVSGGTALEGPAQGSPPPASPGGTPGFAAASGDASAVQAVPWKRVGAASGAPAEEVQPITGANLLVWALAGADLLGTPGFRDLDRDGHWWDDTPDLYALDDGRQPVCRRIGPLIDVGATTPLQRTDALQDHGDVPNDPVLSDGFGQPILYYRSSVGAVGMVSSATGQHSGIYTQADNVLYTGDGYQRRGVDLGAGYRHRLNQYWSNGQEIDIHPSPQMTNLDEPRYAGSFAAFVWDRSVAVRNQPVNRDSYLLISAGADGLWGTADDVVNFTRP